MVEYPHFFLVCHPLILGLCPFSSLHPPQILPHAFQGNGPPFLATEAASAGNAQLGAGACGDGHGRVSEATGIPGNPDAVLLPAASVPTQNSPCLKQHTALPPGKTVPTPSVALLPCLALLVFRKVVYSFAFHFISLH